MAPTLPLLLLAVPGCPGSDPIRVDNAPISIEVRVKNRGQSRYEQASLQIVQVSIRPTDRDADLALGDQPIGLLTVPVDVDLHQPSTTIPAGALHSGRYAVEFIVLQRIEFLDSDPNPASKECLELVVDPGPDAFLDTPDDFSPLPDRRFPAALPPDQVMFEPVDEVAFFLSPGSGTMRIIVDLELLIDAFEDGFLCSITETDTCAIGQGRTVASHACLTEHDADVFPSRFSEFLTVE
jgi:hypothetical protein